MKINAETLKAAGYKYYEQRSRGEYCLGLWQKAVRIPSDIGFAKAYFLDVYLWQFPGLVSASVEVVLYRNDGLTYEGETHIHVSLQLGAETTLEQLEKFYTESYSKLGCVPDLYNNN